MWDGVGTDIGDSGFGDDLEDVDVVDVPFEADIFYIIFCYFL
jgi:hypothetical protein